MIRQIRDHGGEYWDTVGDPAFVGLYIGHQYNHNHDKYAFFIYVYTVDLFIKHKPMWSPSVDRALSSDRMFGMDRIDNTAHYIISNMRWLDAAGNAATK